MRRKLAAAVLIGSAALAGCAETPNYPVKTYPEIVFPSQASGEPPRLGELQGLVQPAPLSGDEAIPPLLAGALRDTALALGARGGLAFRTWQINNMLDGKSESLDDIYQFRRMMIVAPSGSMVSPPVVVEVSQAYTVADDGQSATAADKVYRILKPGKLVTASPDWRSYLVRQWEAPEPPPAQLLPKTRVQQEAWQKWVAEGWDNGIKQAEEIFQADLSRVARDMEGMARYRNLVAQGIITELYLAEGDRGITGGGDEMRIGDRTVRITSPAEFNGRSGDWAPVLIRGHQPDTRGLPK